MQNRCAATSVVQASAKSAHFSAQAEMELCQFTAGEGQSIGETQEYLSKMQTPYPSLCPPRLWRCILMHLVACAHTHTHTQSAAGGNVFGNKVKNTIWEKPQFFYHNPLPKYIFLQRAFTFGKFTSLVSKIWTPCRLLLLYHLISPYFMQSLVAVWKAHLPDMSPSSETGQLCLCWVQGHPASEDAAGVEASPSHLPPRPWATTSWVWWPRCWLDWRRGFVGGKLLPTRWAIYLGLF